MLENWIVEQRNTQGCYGDDLFKRRTFVYDWPVLGSRAADHITDTSDYFDFVARKIRIVHPVKVSFLGESPPESLQVFA